MRRMETRKKSIGQAQLTPDVKRMLEGRTTIKYIQQEQQTEVSDYRVKTSADDGAQGYLMDKITVSGGLTATECLTTDSTSRYVEFGCELALSTALSSGGVLTNNGVGTSWTDVITFGGGNANLKQGAKLIISPVGNEDTISSATTLTANAAATNLQIGGVTKLSMTSAKTDVKNTLYYTGAGTVSGDKPLVIDNTNMIKPYSYSNFYRIDSIDSTSYMMAVRNNQTDSIKIYANKGALITAEDAINLDSNTGTYTLADVPAGSGVPLVLSTATGQIYHTDSAFAPLLRKQIQLTRQQLLYLLQYPVELLPAQAGVLYMPLRFIIKQGGIHNYTGTIYCTFGAAYDANAIISEFPLDNNSVTTVAAFRNCSAQPLYPYTDLREGLPISITTNIAITDSSTSAPINVWLEYTELNCTLI